MQIIHRAAWGARHDNGGGSAPLPASEVWLHHSAGLWPDLVWIDVDADGVEDDEERAMRALEDIGEQRFGRGISYTFVIMPSGRVYEGHSVDRLGSHTGGRNSIARAICYAGNYMTHQPTPAQLRSTALLLQHGVHQGWWRVAALRGGHRDVKPLTGDSVVTDCPGNHAYAAIREINRQAGGPQVSEEDDMAVSDALAQKLDILCDQYLAAQGGKWTTTGPMAAWIVQAATTGADVDEAAIAASVAPLLVEAVTGQLRTIPAEDLARLSTAINDEADRRDRDGDPTTGQTS